MTDREKLTELIGSAMLVDTDAGIYDATAEQIADCLIANGVTFAKDTDVSSKWIPVEDRMPEENDGDHVLVSSTGILRAGAILYVNAAVQAFVCNEGFVDTEFDEILTGVTHWMPLPKPPKEKTDVVVCANCKYVKFFVPPFADPYYGCDLLCKKVKLYNTCENAEKCSEEA